MIGGTGSCAPSSPVRQKGLGSGLGASGEQGARSGEQASDQLPWPDPPLVSGVCNDLPAWDSKLICSGRAPWALIGAGMQLMGQDPPSASVVAPQVKHLYCVSPPAPKQDDAMTKLARDGLTAFTALAAVLSHP
ncbi:MAG: hypothetical protein FRX48_09571 [Lasallia pustulata]|uniref:Uncharacterized protein n=1 Tax=Lasallia pustulata TaxID=136370 RepID=A0A5M8PBF9_9LECA|nr:MAG: hypothetical protein FRX48_09571 [Lasallia pustulata]